MSTTYEDGDINVVDQGYVDGDINTIGDSESNNTSDDQNVRGGEGNALDGGMPKAVLAYLAKSVADDPEAIEIETQDRKGALVLRLHVAPLDMGRVIGRRGRTAQAIRTLVGVAGAKEGVHTIVDIVDA